MIFKRGKFVVGVILIDRRWGIAHNAINNLIYFPSFEGRVTLLKIFFMDRGADRWLGRITPSHHTGETH